ncbi:hypothetical protein EMPS_04911 [Entomortierella parvispora]|uniref:Alpha/beta hydrolase fold-3 domain-containing protein n=1 Tax=Entomortierella parvispora TaxID=205924 RepID=A0A9P3H9X1_9FUNG|nr:hypothetical protein EMPS_04911 [Entomortierella parvispora]
MSTSTLDPVSAKTASATPDQKPSTELPDAVAFTLWFFMGLSGALRYSLLRLTGNAPKTLPVVNGLTVAFVASSGNSLSLRQKRMFFAATMHKVHASVGLGTEEQMAEWSVLVEEKDWKGFWIPFQDRVLSPNDNRVSGERLDVSKTILGQGSDLVIFYVHGGGYREGSALQSMHFLLKVMNNAFAAHGTKISFLAVEYSHAPESPYPCAANECMAAYTSLVRYHGVEPKRIVFCGESAGGNAVHTMTLRIRDDPTLGLSLPTAVISMSPWMMTDPKKESMDKHLFDTLTPYSISTMLEHYAPPTITVEELLESPYVCPLKTSTFAGLPPMLVYAGGVEILRPSIEEFVRRAKADGVACQYELKEERSHCWFQIDPTSTEEDRKEAIESMALYLSKVHKGQL